MRITDALREEHKVFSVRFDELDQLVSLCRDLALLRPKASLLAKGLLSHARIENDILFPLLVRFLGGTGPLAMMKAQHEEIEGGLLGILVWRVDEAELQDPEHAQAAVKGILQIARQHLAMEDKMFWMAEKIVGDSQLNELGQQFAERRRAEPLAWS
ncbi:MAG TPA: hemerythrin domain-containing protein [Terriglobales bacterium]|nr:hemerythrin domain-containing protein [Terriglobales bacterium]